MNVLYLSTLYYIISVRRARKTTAALSLPAGQKKTPPVRAGSWGVALA
jgi:hypothetical protein